jgi:uncharacterized membrane protein
MGGIVEAQVRTAPRRAQRRGFKPVQAITALGCAIVALMALAGLLNLALGRVEIPEVFKDWISVTHFVLVFSTLPLTVVQILLPKGTGLHRKIGYTWSGLLISASLISFGMHGINGGFSPPHFFSALTLVLVPLIMYLALTGRRIAHRSLVLSYALFFLVAAGAFTFVPGRALGDLFWSIWS